MSTGTPLFAPPSTPVRDELRRACVNWLAVLERVRRTAGRSKRDVLLRWSEKYRETYDALQDSCDNAIEAAPDAQRKFLVHVKCLLEPWSDLTSLAQLPAPIMDDLIRQMNQLDCLLQGLEPEQVERRKRIMRQLSYALVAVLAVAAFLLYIGGPTSVVATANQWQQHYVGFVHGITPRQKIGAAALVLVVVGTIVLRSRRSL